MAIDLNNSVTSMEPGIWFGFPDVGDAMSSSVLIGSSIFTVFLDGFVSAAVLAVYFWGDGEAYGFFSGFLKGERFLAALLNIRLYVT